MELVRDAIKSQTNRNNQISPKIKCLAKLRYLATGKMQLCNADDLKILRAINFPLDIQQLRRIKANFMAIAGMPGVVGAIDETHIKIVFVHQHAGGFWSYPCFAHFNGERSEAVL